MKKLSKMPQMTDQEILDAFAIIKRGPSRGSKALNKPILLLFMLGKYWNNSERLLLFREIYFPVQNLLKKFVDEKINKLAVMNPFWHMRTSEQIWTVAGEKSINRWEMSKPSNRRPNTADAMKSALRGGFTPELYHRIINDKAMLLKIVFLVLDFFPTHQHLDLLQAVGIPSMQGSDLFHKKIFEIYNFSCSICEPSGFGHEEGRDLLVAHIWPIEKQGPKEIKNCIAMCDRHKNLFEFGAFTIAKDAEILISNSFRELGGSSELLSYQGKKAHFPKAPNNPLEDYLSWHKEKVFQV